MRIGTSALLAYQRSLSTTSHNVANAGVEGYSRQRVGLSAQVAGSPFGSGVRVTGVERMTDVYANSRLIDDSSGLAASGRLADIAARVDRLMSDADTGMAGAIGDFFAAAQDVAAEPNSLAAREVLLGSADSLASRATALSSALNRLDGEIDQRAVSVVEEANDLIAQLARVNRDIAAGAGSANDLRDERDRLTRELADRIGIRTTLQDGDQLNVYTRDGHALLLGAQPGRLQLQPDPSDPSRLRLSVGRGGSSIPIAAPGGGELGGLYAARGEILDPARDRLGALVGDLATAANAAQAAGTDLDGAAGAPLFRLGAPVAVPNAGNTGSATLDVSIVGDAPLPEGGFTLRYSGGGWQISSVSGQAPTLSGSGSAGDPLRVGGVAVTVSGTPAEGDRFRLRPGADALAGLQSSGIGARQIAAAGALTPTLGSANSGTLELRALQTTDASDPGARAPAEIVFEAPGSYRIDGGALQSLGGDGRIDGPGWSLQLAGRAAAGDRIRLAPTGANSADNAGANRLAGLAGTPLTASGATPAGAYADLVAAGGVASRQAEASRDGFERLMAADVAAREAVAGVNLDEEAAKLLRLQQAYQAASKVIAVADDLFQSLLAAVRR